MVVKRIGPLSFAKISGMLYGLMGLIIGACISLFSVVGGAFAPGRGSGAVGMLFGAAAIVVLPIVYGLVGFVISLISAALYNLVAGWVGGVELDVQ
jgi:hypothetical protein